MALDYALAFRATAAYATDGANTHKMTCEDGVHADEIYPTTSDGVTYGWPTGTDDSKLIYRDRSAGNIHILRGHHRTAVGAASINLRVDLPNAGDFELHYAIGDATYAMSAGGLLVIKDGSTTLDTISLAGTSGANHFIDAAGTEHNSDTLWESNEAGVIYTFASTTLWFNIGGPSSTATTILAYLRIVEQAAPPSGGRRIHVIG